MGQEMRARGWDKKITKVVGFDARGFIYGPLIAQEIGAGFVRKLLQTSNLQVMLRKKGKLPGDKITIKYTTEYSEDILEILKDSFTPDDKFLLVDDLVATGGTLDAGVRALAQTNEIVGCLCVLKVDALLNVATEKLAPYEIVTII